MKAIYWIWCFPQMLLGLIVKIVTRAKWNGACYEYSIKSGSVSLGEYIFLCPSHRDNPEMLKHEQGHRKQSHLLGWLYLPVIGIPSIIWAGCCKEYRKRCKISYYDFYTEKWADKLGGIER